MPARPLEIEIIDLVHRMIASVATTAARIITGEIAKGIGIEIENQGMDIGAATTIGIEIGTDTEIDTLGSDLGTANTVILANITIQGVGKLDQNAITTAIDMEVGSTMIMRGRGNSKHDPDPPPDHWRRGRAPDPTPGLQMPWKEVRLLREITSKLSLQHLKKTRLRHFQRHLQLHNQRRLLCYRPLRKQPLLQQTL